MKTRKELLREWWNDRGIVRLITFYEGTWSHYADVYGTTEEDAKHVIGGFNDKQTYYKLPDNIFKVKVTKSQEAYVSDYALTRLKSEKRCQGIFATLHENSFYPYVESEVNKVTITWEELEEIK